MIVEHLYIKPNKNPDDNGGKLYIKIECSSKLYMANRDAIMKCLESIGKIEE